MARYVIEIPDTGYVPEEDGQLYLPLKSAECDNSIAPVWLITGYHCEPYTEPDEQEIRQEAEQEVWDLISEINCMSEDELLQVYGIHESRYIDDSYAYSEAKAKYDAWKEEKEKICVGDEVGYYGVEDAKGKVNYEGVVIEIRTKDNTCQVMERDGSVYEIGRGRINYKTGRHFPQVAELLKKMGKET